MSPHGNSHVDQSMGGGGRGYFLHVTIKSINKKWPQSLVPCVFQVCGPCNYYQIRSRGQYLHLRKRGPGFTEYSYLCVGFGGGGWVPWPCNAYVKSFCLPP